MKKTGATVLCESLVDEGVEVVFGYPGGAILPAYDALLNHRIRHVLVRHEQGAAHMADGYARASGRVGVAIATSGPGATNLVTGIATAMLDSVPMVCLTGQVPSGLLGRDAFQEVDVTGITLPITKHNYLVTRPEEIRDVVREAFHVARSGRPGPVLVDITKDAQQGFVEVDEELIRPRSDQRFSVMDSDLDRIAELVHAAQHPVILAGRGILQAGAEDLLLEFAEQSEIPVTSTLLGLGGFPASHPLHLGMMGMHGESWVNTAIQESDLLIALGMRFDDRVTGKLATYAPTARKIHVDIDPAELNKNVTVDVGVAGDVKEVIERLLPRLQPSHRRDWITHIHDLKGSGAVRDIQQLPDTGVLHAAHVIHDLWQLTSGDALLVTDVGQHQMWAAQYYKHERPHKLITSGGLGTMGFALPAAIGAKLASPKEEVWVVAGDGGLQMTAAELTTCLQESRILSKRVGIVGFGSQGHAHALNLRDSGVDVRVGLHAGSKSRVAAEAQGLTVTSVSELTEWADLVTLLAHDTVQPSIYKNEMAGRLRGGQTLMFGHGFNIHYRTIEPPPEVDVAMVAPKAPGHRVRETFESGQGTPSLVAVHQDSSGAALTTALSYAWGLGSARAGILETTFAEETETDLFGEQAVLCGGVSALVKAGFETLVDAGYQPEIAYFECLHELKLIVDLFYRGGLGYMRHSVSETAEYGDYTAGNRVINADVRSQMAEILSDVRDGSFARRWIEENEKGQPEFQRMRAAERDHPIEVVGRELRRQMTFLDPVEIESGEDRSPAAVG